MRSLCTRKRPPLSGLDSKPPIQTNEGEGKQTTDEEELEEEEEELNL